MFEQPTPPFIPPTSAQLERLVAHGQALHALASRPDPGAAQVAGTPLESAARLGLLAGSFNPPTLAHQHLARAALESGALDRLWYVLSTRTVDKEIVTGAALEDRLLMLDTLVAADPRLGVLLVNRGLYVDQARLLTESFPELRGLVFVVGFDKIVQIFDPRYYEDRDAALEELFGLASFLVAPRGAHDETALATLLGQAENRRFAGAVRPLSLPSALREVASSAVRQGLAGGGATVTDAVPPAVAAFMDHVGLYAPDDRYARRLALLESVQLSRSDRAQIVMEETGANLDAIRFLRDS